MTEDPLFGTRLFVCAKIGFSGTVGLEKRSKGPEQGEQAGENKAANFPRQVLCQLFTKYALLRF